MAQATHTAPIGIDQINNTYYVWGAGGVGFNTIQEAVDYIRTQAGAFPGEIVVVHGHGYGEDIPSITGGSLGIPIVDQRDERNQRYFWDGTQYAPLPFKQESYFQTTGKVPATSPVGLNGATTVDFTIAGGAGNGRGDVNVWANTGKGMPAIALSCIPGDGTPQRTFFRGDQNPLNGNFRAQIPAQLILTNPELLENVWIGQPYDINISKGMSIHAKPAEDSVVFQGKTQNGVFNQAIRLNPLGGDIQLGQVMAVHANGDVFTKSLTLTEDFSARNVHVTNTLHVGGPGGFDQLLAANGAFWLGPGGPGIAGTKGMLGSAIPGFIDLQGMTQPGTYDQTIRLNHLGGDVQIGTQLTFHPDGTMTGLASLDVTGNVTIGGDLAATNAFFSEAEVDGSPVRTFANSPDAPSGMVWPVAGIAVSTGSAWENPSLDPATLATWPTAGIPVSTGSAWGTSIDPATLPSLTQPNVFTQSNKFYGDLSCALNCQGSNTFPTLNEGNLKITWNLAGTSGETDFLNCNGGAGGGFRWYSGASGAAVTSTTPFLMYLHGSSGKLDVPGGMAGTFFSGAQPNVAGFAIPSSIAITTQGSTAYLDAYGVNPTTQGDFNFRSTRSDGTSTLSCLTLNNTLAAFISGKLSVLDRANVAGFTNPNINSDGNSIVINPKAGMGLYLNWESGSGVNFGNGSSTPKAVASIDNTGAAKFGATGVYRSALGAVSSITIGEDPALSANWAGGFISFTPNNGAGSLGTFNIAASKTGQGYSDIAIGVSGSNVFLGSGSTTTTSNGPIAAKGGVNVTGALTATAGINCANVGMTGGSQGPSIYMRDNTGALDQKQWCQEVFGGTQMRYRVIADNGASDSVFLIFSRGAGLAVNTTVNGNFTVAGGTKAFMVPHPLDETKDLYHACLEGPENGVYYRGEAVVVDGYAEVTLPDYFEALTFTEDRSVQLTQIFEGGTLFARMAASRIVDGKFTIHATEAVTVAWEVKAVRRIGVDKLKVVADKYVPPITDDAPMMPDAPKTTAGKTKAGRHVD